MRAWAVVMVAACLLGCAKEESTMQAATSASSPAQALADALGQGDAAEAARLLAAAPTLLEAPLDALKQLPLHVAVRGGSLACVEAVLAAGAAVDAGAGPMQAPASFAVFDGHPPRPDILQALLAAGASPTAALPDGSTLLLAACRNGETPVAAVDALLAAGADAVAPAREGLTPLHWAVINRRPDLVLALRRAGADPTDPTRLAYGMTPMAVALLGLEATPDELSPAQFAFAQTHQLLNREVDALLASLTDPLPAADPDAVAKVVAAWLTAVQAGDRAAADALGTPAFLQHEQEWAPSFSHSFFEQGSTLLSYEIGAISALEGGRAGGAVVQVRARLARPDGSEDREGMVFTLAKQADGRWLITDLR